MKITFLGTGEACDKDRHNTSIYIEEDGGHLLDCGFTTPHVLLRQQDAQEIQTIWISHFHGDHFFGIPLLIVHYFMLGRETPLTLCSGVNPQDKIEQVINLAYPGILDKLTFPLGFVHLQPGKTITMGGLSWQCSPVRHSQSACALRLSTANASLYYSGDGKPTLEAVKLIKKCDYVIHEAFSMRPSIASHSSIEECLLLAEELRIKKLALVHLNSQTRRLLETGEASVKQPAHTQLFLPEDGDSFQL